MASNSKRIVGEGSAVTAAPSADLGHETIAAKLARIGENIKQRQAQRAADGEGEEGGEPLAPALVPPTAVATNTAIRKRLAAIEIQLAKQEADGYFVSYPIQPGSEFPTLLTRLPIFLPTQRARQRKLVNQELAFSFTTPFGDGKRHGPPLTVRDEDTLIALMRLRSKRLYGYAPKLPVTIEHFKSAQQGRVGVHAVICSISDVVRELGLSDGGLNLKRTLASVKRLAHTTLELNLKTHERYLGAVQTGRVLSLLHVQWQTYEDNGLLVVQFPPVVAHWLEHEYTYIDLAVRRELGPLGKCLHRYLASQRPTYRGEVAKIARAVGYDGPTKNMKQRFKRSLDQLVALKWLKSYRFSGNGRSSPLMLRINR